MVLNIDVCAALRDAIPVGRVAENEVTAVAFGLSSWIAEYGSGTVTLTVQRWTDKNPYIVPLTIENGVAVWTITDTDTAVKGLAQAQLTYYVGEKVKKSRIYKLKIANSLVGSAIAPSPYDDWLATLQALTAQTEANAASAQASADEAAAIVSDGLADIQSIKDSGIADINQIKADTIAEAQSIAAQSAASATASAQSATQAAQSASTAQGYATSAEASKDESGAYAQAAQASAEAAAHSVAAGGYISAAIDDERLVITLTNMDDVTFRLNDERLEVAYG